MFSNAPRMISLVTGSVIFPPRALRGATDPLASRDRTERSVFAGILLGLHPNPPRRQGSLWASGQALDQPRDAGVAGHSPASMGPEGGAAFRSRPARFDADREVPRPEHGAGVLVGAVVADVEHRSTGTAGGDPAHGVCLGGEPARPDLEDAAALEDLPAGGTRLPDDLPRLRASSGIDASHVHGDHWPLGLDVH